MYYKKYLLILISLIMFSFLENTQYIDGVKIGVLSGSLLSTVFGFLLLLMSAKK